MEYFIQLIETAIISYNSQKAKSHSEMLSYNLGDGTEPKRSPEYYQGCIDSLTDLHSKFA